MRAQSFHLGVRSLCVTRHFIHLLRTYALLRLQLLVAGKRAGCKVGVRLYRDLLVFRRLYPRIDLELTVAQSTGLERRAESGHLDVAFIKRETGVTHGQLVRRDRLAWVAVEDAHVDPSRPIPLVVYQAPSVTRSLGIQALDRVGLSHRITCTIRGVNGLLAATRAGLGVAIFAQSLTPDDLVELPAEAQLPELGELDLVLLTGPRAPTEAANALITAIMSRAWVRTRTAA